MPDISALSLQSAQMPTVAAPLENARIAAESASMAGLATPAPSFDALLALQAQAQAASPASPAIPAEAIAILPEGGKSLPDDASTLAAKVPPILSQPILLKSATARTAANRGASAEVPVQTPIAEAADETVVGAADFDPEAQSAPVPDIALFAAIFAAPERLANAPADELATPATVAAGAASPTRAAPSAPSPAVPGPITVAIASTAQIEVISAVTNSPVSRTAPAPAPVSTLTTGQVAEAGEAAPALPVTPAAIPVSGPVAGPASGPIATSAPASPLAVPVAPNAAPAGEAATEARLAKGIATAPETSPAATAPQTAESTIPEAQADTMPDTIWADAPVHTGAQPVSATTRAEAKAERIDFATLVDTLNRAREEASPRTLNVAVTNTDFGRVSIRFDSSDAGLSVAMSAADPGFVRAVSASSEAASTNADPRGQNGQPQGDSGAARQQQGQPSQQQQTGTARGDARPLANYAPELRKDDSAASGAATSGAKTGESGIYA